MKRTAVTTAVTLALVLGAGQASAQSSRYSTWSNPDSQASSPAAKASGEVQEMVDELRRLVDDAKKVRAADPAFLRDLEDLVYRYDTPWRVRVLYDDFVDGDFTQNPAWTVSDGKFWVERGYGLRSSIAAMAAPATTSQDTGEKKVEGRDVAIAILGQILNQGARQQQPSNQPATAAVAQKASIHVAQRLTNAFSLKVQLTSWKKEGRLEMGPYQGRGREAGYRLVYTPGGRPAFQLLRTSVGRTSVVEALDAELSLEDQKVHEVLWTRGTDGTMAVALDGKELFRTLDRGFRDSWDGVVITNRGGDYILSRVEAYGTQ